MIGKQLFQERLNSPGRLPSLSSPLSSRSSSLSRSRSLQQPVALHMTSETTLFLAVGFFICALLVFAWHEHVHDAKPATVLGKRSWKDVDLTKSQVLELQLAKRDEEIDVLRSRLRSIIASSRVAEANRASQEALIMSLQQRHEAEKQQKYTAIFALAERSRALDECNMHQMRLEHELTLCRGQGAPS